MKIHFTAAFMVIVAGFFFKISKCEWLFLFIAIFSVIISEMINSAVEEFLDLFFPEFNEKVGKIKDISAGIVLMFSFMSVLIGLIIFLPKILQLF